MSAAITTARPFVVGLAFLVAAGVGLVLAALPSWSERLPPTDAD